MSRGDNTVIRCEDAGDGMAQEDRHGTLQVILVHTLRYPTLQHQIKPSAQA